MIMMSLSEYFGEVTEWFKDHCKMALSLQRDNINLVDQFWQTRDWLVGWSGSEFWDHMGVGQ